jgi:predicted DNA-binding transcriptional regulator AlpA
MGALLRAKRKRTTMIDNKESSSATSFEGILMNWRDLEELTKVSRRTLDRLVREQKFPKPIRIGKSYRWWAKDVMAHLAESRVG